MRAAMLIVLLPLAACTHQTAQSARFECSASTQNEWLTSEPRSASDALTIDRTLVRPVEADLAAAIARLVADDTVELSPADLTRFGVAAAPESEGRPYLVRAVFPTPRPVLSAAWREDTLHITARGLGCAPFAKHPVVVFLKRQPTSVTVAASAAL